MYYSVIVVQKDAFESKIIDERYFKTRVEAENFACKYSDNDNLEAFIMCM